MGNYYNNIIRKIEKDDLGRGYLYWYCNSVIRQNFIKLGLNCSDSDIEDLVYRYVHTIVGLLDDNSIQLLGFDNKVHEFIITDSQDSLGVLNAIFEEAFKNNDSDIDYENILLNSDKRFLVIDNVVYGSIPDDIGKYIWEKHRHGKYAEFVKNIIENPNQTNVFCRKFETCPGNLVAALKDFMLNYDKYLVKSAILDDDIHKLYGVVPSSGLYPVVCSFSKVIGNLDDYVAKLTKLSNDDIFTALNRKIIPTINLNEIKFQVGVNGLSVEEAYQYCLSIKKKYSIQQNMTNTTFLKILKEIVKEYNS